MIGALVERLARSVTAADFVETADDTLTALVDAGGDVSLAHQTWRGLHLRVARNGRVGWAGGRADRAETVADQALRAAAAAPPLDLMLPAPSPLSAVVTSDGAAARCGPPEVLGWARGLRDRLARPGRTVEVWAERSSGVVRVGNTRGVTAEYPKTVVGVGAVVRGPGIDRGAPLRVQVADVATPDPGRLDRLAAAVDRWTGLPVLDDWEPGPVAAWLAPEAVRTVLGPVLLGLVGERWCRPDDGPGALDPRLALTDDPHASGRPGTRPICDDGVPTRVVELIRDGRVRQGIVDLATAARFGRPATGHGVRPALGAPRPGFSNLRLAPGDADDRALARALGTGLLLLELPWGPAPSRAAGRFRARCPWALAVRGGEVVGRLDGPVLTGNAFDLLRNVRAVGAEAPWRGSWALPALVVDGLRLDPP